MSIPIFLQSALWSYDLDKMDRENDKRTIITQILNYGTWEQVKWLLRNYSLEEIRDVLKEPSRGMWHDDVLNYWSTILNLKISEDKWKKALFSVGPKSN